MVAYLVPARTRLELYSEAHEDAADVASGGAGWLRRWTRHLAAQWRQMADGARSRSGAGRPVTWRDRLVHHVAESIAEQRTLWALRHASEATARFPATVSRADAHAALEGLLAHARRLHGRWLLIDLAITAITGPLFFFVPGPNVISWYFAFRVLGHLQSWRGARQAMDRTAWTFEPDKELAELAALVNVPRGARAQRVAAIAARLNLRRLPAFFDRVTV